MPLEVDEGSILEEEVLTLGGGEYSSGKVGKFGRERLVDVAQIIDEILWKRDIYRVYL